MTGDRPRAAGRTAENRRGWARGRLGAAAVLVAAVAAGLTSVRAAVPAAAQAADGAGRVVIVLDVSDAASVGAGAEGVAADCNADGAVDDRDDLNRDGLVGTVLDCEVAAGIAIVTAVAAEQPATEVSVAVFGASAALADVGEPLADGANPVDDVIGPTTDRDDGDRDRTADVVQALTSARRGGIDLHRPVEVGADADPVALAALLAAPDLADADAFLLASGAGTVGDAAISDDAVDALAGRLGTLRAFAIGADATCDGWLARTGAACTATAEPFTVIDQLLTPVAPAADGDGPVRYVALGDSYSAGEGLDNGHAAVPLPCHRALRDAFPALVADDISTLTGRGVELTHGACAGARMRHVLADAQDVDGPNPPQLDLLGPSTELVTITVGGNDIGFSAIAGHCAVHADCADDDYVELGDGRSLTLAAWADTRFPSLQAQLVALHRVIAHRAPAARRYVATYPRLIAEQPRRVCTTRLLLSESERVFLAGVAERLEAATVAAATATGAVAVPMVDAFAGREVCARLFSDDEWVDDVRFDPTNPPFFVAPGTFHPNRAGHRAYAAEVMDTIRADPTWP
ncbi:MAG: SGNH/GDSL hydrolase family protein [Actinomycetota bacterium]|nr:SGNH/GDSL hydrolase family protein [Actinomycetota bacterium]